jgi:hypothetical protein
MKWDSNMDESTGRDQRIEGDAPNLSPALPAREGDLRQTNKE